MDSTRQTEYTLQHDTTGVIVKVYERTPAKAKEYLIRMLEDLLIFFPEGEWNISGVKPITEEW